MSFNTWGFRGFLQKVAYGTSATEQQVSSDKHLGLMNPRGSQISELRFQRKRRRRRI
jgi:hypothetical protein